jgi:hypothetical protein
VSDMANEEMIEGFRDGYDLDAPEPSDNRSHSYRHGFKAGRNDKLPHGQGPFHGISAEEIREMAAKAIAKDCA